MNGNGSAHNERNGKTNGTGSDLKKFPSNTDKLNEKKLNADDATLTVSLRKSDPTAKHSCYLRTAFKTHFNTRPYIGLGTKT